MWKKIVLGIVGILGAAIVVVLVVASFQPAASRIERHVVIAASPAEIYAVVSDLRRFPEWSPWSRLDPDMTKTFTGRAGTVGASFAWRGNGQVGAGKMTFTEVRPNELVRLRLDFLEPFAATNRVEWKLTPQSGGATELSWEMTGERNLIMKAMSLFMNMDGMVGDDFQRGLATLKRIVEAEHH